MVRIVNSIDTTTKKAVHNGAEGLARGRTLARLTWGGLERPDRVDLSMVEAARRCNEVLTTDSQKYGGCEKMLCIVRDTILAVCHRSVEEVKCLSLVITLLKCCKDKRFLQYK